MGKLVGSETIRVRPEALDASALMTSVPQTPDATPTAAERFVAGKMLAGRYRLVDRLGKGAMGEVYKAEDVLLGLPVALKFLPREKELDLRSREMLLDELKVARLIADDHVCRLWDVGQHVEDGKTLHCITMELIRGDTVDGLLKQVGRFPEETVVTWALQLAGAGRQSALPHADGAPAREWRPSGTASHAALRSGFRAALQRRPPAGR